ncbi:hypothetical protein Dimus_035117 [Dionaea muscipula]
MSFLSYTKSDSNPDTASAREKKKKGGYQHNLFLRLSDLYSYPQHHHHQGLRNYKNLSDLLGDGIFTVDGEKWRHQRKIFSYEFSKKFGETIASIVLRENAAKLANVVVELQTLIK